MRIRDVMQADVEVVDSAATLDEAAYIMMSAGIGILAVADGEKLVGVITDRDIIKRAVSEGLDSVSTKVRDIMSSAVVTCGEEADTDEAVGLMARYGVRRVIILDGQGEPSGTLSAEEIVSAGALHPAPVLAPQINSFDRAA